MLKRVFKFIIIIIIIAGAAFLAYRYNYIPHLKYSDADFGITRTKSEVDADGDGVEDYRDILQSAKDYLETKPKYKSKYYETTGYPNDEYGVCTDVIGFALGGAGYDLMQLVSEDIQKNAEDYDIDTPDSAIDFRRVKNLRVYFDHTAVSLTTDISEIDKWQAGDIVIWKNHIGLISDKRNHKGIPFVLHHANPIQASYEEDILETWGEIVGHYRIKGEETDPETGKDRDDALNLDDITEDEDSGVAENNDDVLDFSDMEDGDDAISYEDSNDQDSEEYESGLSDEEIEENPATDSAESSDATSLLSSVTDLNFHSTDAAGSKYVFTYGDEEFSAVYTPDNWKIIDSYKIDNEKDMLLICQTLIDEHPIHGSDMTSYRTADDMVYEWLQHNILYEMLPSDSHWIQNAKDVDFDPQDQNKSYEELYERRTGKELTLDDILSHIGN